MPSCGKLFALSPRESEVLSLLGKGKTTKEIADALALSVETIATYRKGICKKLDVHSTASLIAYATEAASQAKGS